MAKRYTFTIIQEYEGCNVQHDDIINTAVLYKGELIRE